MAAIATIANFGGLGQIWLCTNERLISGMALPVFAEKLFMKWSCHRYFDSVWIGTFDDKGDADLIERVENALSIIRQHDLVRYRRIIRCIPRIWIIQLYQARGSYSFALKRCNLDAKFVRSSALESIASTIVHEATHAHPCMEKIGYSEAVRARVEQICMRQQLAFADKLPDGAKVRADVERNLARPLAFWSNQAAVQRNRDALWAEARDIGFPDWLTRSCLAVGKAVWMLTRRWR